MSSLPRSAVIGAALGGVALAVNGAIRLAGAHIDESSVSTAAEYAVLFSFTVALLVLVAPVLELARRAGALVTGRVAGAGQLMLAVVCIVSAINGGDTAAFNVVAPIGNLLWLGGWIWLAVRTYRVQLLSRAAAAAVPLTWIAALPFARVGGGVLAGAVWLVAAWALAGGRVPRTRAVAAPIAEAR
jgi:uncharacterized membrane protein YgdD (TMEM256/DUF423 family)